MIQTTWLEKLFRPLVIALMIGVVMFAIVRVIRMVMPQWDGTYLVAGAMLVSLEAHYSHFLLKRSEVHGFDRVRFRLTEVGVLFLLIKLGSYVGKGWAVLWADVLYWPSDPTAFLLDGESLVAFVLALMAWSTTLQLAVDLDAVDMPLLDPEDGGESPGGPERILYAHRFEPREALPLESFIGRFVFGGMVLLAATGIARLGVGPLLEGQGAGGSRLEVTLLLYFVLGLVMMAQIRYAALRKQWWIEGVSVTSDVTGRWVRYTLLLLAAAALLALVLPTQPALRVLVVAGGVLDLIMWVGALIMFVLLLLIMFPLFYLWWLLTRFFTESGGEPPVAPVAPLPPPFVPNVAAAPPDWYTIIQFLLFWSVVGWALLALLRAYLRDHPEMVATIVSSRPFRLLRALLDALRKRVHGVAATVRERLPHRLPTLRRSASGRARVPFFRLRRLPPREQIFYHYLSTLRRAAQQGLPRGAPDTPYEYGENLEAKVPAAQEALARLTEEFVAARYSARPITPEEGEQARREAATVRAALQARERAARAVDE